MHLQEHKGEQCIFKNTKVSNASSRTQG